jgi:hypothetical protein
MSPISAILLCCISIWVLTAPRRWALVGTVVGLIYLTQGHLFQLGDFNFMPNRVLVYLCFARVVARREFSFSAVNKMDIMFVVLYAYVTVVLILRPEESIYLRLAKAMDVFGAYFGFRGLIYHLDDFKWLLRVLALILVPFVSLIAFESTTAKNLFSIVGGNTAVWMRDDSVRCFGSFRHPSLLGSLGATFFPLYVGLLFDKQNRGRAILGIGLSMAIVYFSSSGGPLSAWATGIIGWLMWYWRKKMRIVRWVAAAGVLALAVVMKAPIWYLLAKISSVTGGTGWHRAYLIDIAIRYIDRWWLLGIPLKETHGWFPYNLAATGGADVTNQYIAFGFQGGLLAIGLFFLFLINALKLVGTALNEVRSSFGRPSTDEFLLWGMGVMLAVHLSNWLGITYWDQFAAVWLLQAAAVSGACTSWSSRSESSGVMATAAAYKSLLQNPQVDFPSPHRRKVPTS